MIKIGDRVRITHIEDEEGEPSIVVGDEGVVHSFSDGRWWIKFDKGAYLGMLPEDELEVIGDE